MRILLVEDESTLAAQLAQALTQAGYAVDHAADGIDADTWAPNIRMTRWCSTWACPGSMA